MALCWAALAGLPAAAAAQDPPFLDVTSLLPPLGVPATPEAASSCPGGEPACVDAVIADMTERFDVLAQRCDHGAVFALSYLRTTEEYRRTIADPAFFADPAWVNREDVAFAEIYFAAFDAYAAGRRADTPPAWLIAFDASRDRAVNGYGSLLLGINAHVQRDLPFVLAGLGLVAPDGTSRKDDHDRVNAFLNRVTVPLIDEIARRFDPTVDDADVPGTTLDTFLAFQVIPAWRETAWRNAERLVTARTAADREAVTRSIEDYAATSARTIALGSAYGLLNPGGADARDAFCRAARDGGA